MKSSAIFKRVVMLLIFQVCTFVHSTSQAYPAINNFKVNTQITFKQNYFLYSPIYLNDEDFVPDTISLYGGAPTYPFVTLNNPPLDPKKTHYLGFS